MDTVKQALTTPTTTTSTVTTASTATTAATQGATSSPALTVQDKNSAKLPADDLTKNLMKMAGVETEKLEPVTPSAPGTNPLEEATKKAAEQVKTAEPPKATDPKQQVPVDPKPEPKPDTDKGGKPEQGRMKETKQTLESERKQLHEVGSDTRTQNAEAPADGARGQRDLQASQGTVVRLRAALGEKKAVLSFLEQQLASREAALEEIQDSFKSFNNLDYLEHYDEIERLEQLAWDCRTDVDRLRETVKSTRVEVDELARRLAVESEHTEALEEAANRSAFWVSAERRALNGAAPEEPKSDAETVGFWASLRADIADSEVNGLEHQGAGRVQTSLSKAREVTRNRSRNSSESHESTAAEAALYQLEQRHRTAV